MALGVKALTAPEHACIHLALERAISATHDHPTLRSVYAEVIRIAGGDTDDPDLIPAASGPRYVLRRFVDGDLSGQFEDESTVVFDENSPLVVVDPSELFARGERAAPPPTLGATAWIQAGV